MSVLSLRAARQGFIEPCLTKGAHNLLGLIQGRSWHVSLPVFASFADAGV
jgi:hypothetical protein